MTDSHPVESTKKIVFNENPSLALRIPSRQPATHEGSCTQRSWVPTPCGNYGCLQTVNPAKSIKPIKSAKSDQKTISTEKEKVKRIITNTEKWTFLPEDLTPESQMSIMVNIHNNTIPLQDEHKAKLIQQQIHQKIYGYMSQDIAKNILCTEKLVDLPKILEMITECEMKCFYCKQPVMVLYEYARDPRQWTVERIDNKYGHNKDNVAIACLNCNLRRRTMYHERYMFTKNLNIVKAI